MHFMIIRIKWLSSNLFKFHLVTRFVKKLCLFINLAVSYTLNEGENLSSAFSISVLDIFYTYF